MTEHKAAGACSCANCFHDDCTHPERHEHSGRCVDCGTTVAHCHGCDNLHASSQYCTEWCADCLEYRARHCGGYTDETPCTACGRTASAHGE